VLALHTDWRSRRRAAVPLIHGLALEAGGVHRLRWPRGIWPAGDSRSLQTQESSRPAAEPGRPPRWVTNGPAVDPAPEPRPPPGYIRSRRRDLRDLREGRQLLRFARRRNILSSEISEASCALCCTYACERLDRADLLTAGPIIVHSNNDTPHQATEIPRARPCGQTGPGAGAARALGRCNADVATGVNALIG